jgi:hypothetical protein
MKVGVDALVGLLNPDSSVSGFDHRGISISGNAVRSGVINGAVRV